jgi:hypothetical protein
MNTSWLLKAYDLLMTQIWIIEHRDDRCRA